MRQERITEEITGHTLLERLRELTVPNDDELKLFIKESLNPYFVRINKQFNRIYRDADTSLKHFYIVLDLWDDLLTEDLADDYDFVQKLSKITDKFYTELNNDTVLINKLFSLSSAITNAKKIYNLINEPDAYNEGEENRSDYAAYLVATLLPIIENFKESLKIRCLVVDIFSSDLVAKRLLEDSNLEEYAKRYNASKNDLLFLKLTKEVLDREDLNPDEPKDQRAAVTAFLKVVNPSNRQDYTTFQKWAAYRALFLPNLFASLDDLSFTSMLYYRILEGGGNKKSVEDLLNDFKDNLTHRIFSQAFLKVIKEKSIILEYAFNVVEAVADLPVDKGNDAYVNLLQIVKFSSSTSNHKDHNSSLIDAYETYKKVEEIINRISTFYDDKFFELVNKIQQLQETLQQKESKYQDLFDRLSRLITKLSSKNLLVKEHFDVLVTLANGNSSEYIVMKHILSESEPDSDSSFMELIDEVEKVIASKDGFSFFSRAFEKPEDLGVTIWLEKEGQKDHPFYGMDWGSFLEAASEGITVIFHDDANDLRPDLSKGKAEEHDGSSFSA